MTAAGNFEGRNILHLKPIAVGQDGPAPCAATPRNFNATCRKSRPTSGRPQPPRAPGRDDKVLVSWNGLMIDAMARAGAALDEPRYRAAAAAAADFLLDAASRRQRPPAALLAGGQAQAAGLSRRPCQPDATPWSRLQETQGSDALA